MKLHEYHAYVESWFAEGTDHLGNVDIQVVQQIYPQLVAWEWAQWDGAEMPDGKIVALRSTVYVADHRQASYASCAVFSQNDWREITRIEFGDLEVVRAFRGRTIASMSEKGIEEEVLRAAFRQDVELVRKTALRVLAMSHVPVASAAASDPELTGGEHEA